MYQDRAADMTVTQNDKCGNELGHRKLLMIPAVMRLASSSSAVPGNIVREMLERL